MGGRIDSDVWDIRNDTGWRRQLEAAECSRWLFPTSMFAVVVPIGDIAFGRSALIFEFI